jgi:hypothetical protein
MTEDMRLNTSSDLAEETPNLTIGQPTDDRWVVAVVKPRSYNFIPLLFPPFGTRVHRLDYRLFIR